MNTLGKTDILSMLPREIEKIPVLAKEPKYRIKQLISWLHAQNLEDFNEMSSLPRQLREELGSLYYINRLREIDRQSADDGTIKFLFELHDKNSIETVLMRHDYGNSLCISSQVGCAMGCTFCASTIGGRVRNLSASEMLGQISAAASLSGLPVDSVVIMGIGEPLDNFYNLLRFLNLVRLPEGLGMSHRRISLSTCGLADKIEELAEHKLQITLSVSLHAPDNALRDSLMPINRRFPVEALMASCRRYYGKTKRRISYEYALIDGINDSIRQADALAALLKGQNCHINLIPINNILGRGFTRPDRQRIQSFRQCLEGYGFSATVRRELGSQIDAACGQLRRSRFEEE
jgi:23S rRNA (adenine2503-C2)-methyltransferase